MKQLPIYFIILFGFSLVSYAENIEKQKQYISGLSAYPSLIEVRMKPGTLFSRTIEVRNLGHERVKIRSYVWDLWFKGDQFDYAPPGTYEQSAAPWITVSPAKAEIRAGGKKRFRFNIFVPKGASGGNFAMLFFDNLPTPAIFAMSNKESVSNLRLGINVFVRVEGTIKSNLEIDQIKINNNKETGEVGVEINVKNEGNVHLKPMAAAIIEDDKKRLVGKIELKKTMGNIVLLPGQSGVYNGKWKQVLTPGRYTALATFSYDKNRFTVKEYPFVIK